MVLFFEKLRNFARMGAALLLLTTAFLPLPLAFARLTGEKIPLYGVVKFADFTTVSMLACGIILLFPSRLKNLLFDRKLRLLLIAAGVFALNILIHSPLSRSIGNLFWVLVPLAAAALAPELRRIMPFFASAGAILLIASGIMSENFTGLTGNWNWSQGLIAALLPALVLLFPCRKTVVPGVDMVICRCHRRNQALILLAAFFGGMIIFYPQEFSRAALIAAFGGGGWLFIRRRIPDKTIRRYLLLAVIPLLLLFALFLLTANLPDTRFRIWEGALKIFLANPLAGAGYGNFSEVIREFLSEAYYFSAFPSVHIDHAHNDLLHLAAENGVAGIVFYVTGVLTVLRRREKSSAGILCCWIFLILLICGCFDQHNFTLTGGCFLAFSAGILLSPANPPELKPSFAIRHLICIPAGVILIFAALFEMSVNLQNSSWIRQGDLKLLAGDLPGAQRLYILSLRQEKTAHALYQLAEIYLVTGKPGMTLAYIDHLNEYCGKTNYRHARRLQAVAALQTGNIPLAVEAMEKEMKNAPFSLINARFQRVILRAAKADPAVVTGSDRHFFQLCRMRKITPQAVETLPVDIDDGAFPEDIRKKKQENRSFTGTLFREIGTVLLMLLALYGTGNAVMKKFSVKDPVVSVACGMVLWGALTLVIPGNILQYLLVIPAVPGAFAAWKNLRDSWQTALLFTLLFIFFLGSSLLPPSAWDEQVYQISLLKKYLSFASTAVLMDNPYSAYPSLGHLWVLPGVAAGGIGVPKILLLAVNLLLLARFYQYLCRYGKILALVAVTAILFSPLTWILLRAFYVESFIVFFGFAAVVLLAGENSRKNIFLAGVMAGAATAVKLTGAGVSLAVLVLLLTDRERRRQWWIFACGGIAAVLPFFLRVWICCGNPFYPYFSGIAGGSDAACMVEEFHRALGGNYGISPWWGCLLNEINCVLDFRNYDGISPGYQFILLFFILIALLIFDRCRHRWLWRGALAVLVMWIFWNFTAQQSRFLYPVLYALAFMMVYGATLLQLKWRQLTGIALIAASGLSVYLHFAEFKHYLLSWNSLQEARKSPVHFAAWISGEEQYAEVALQLQTLSQYKVASLWDRRTLYFPDNVRILMPGFQEKLTPVPENSAGLYAVLKDYDYLMIRPPQKDVDKGIEFIPGAVKLNQMLFELLRQGRAEISHRTSDGQISILRIVPETAPITVRDNK